MSLAQHVSVPVEPANVSKAFAGHGEAVVAEGSRIHCQEHMCSMIVCAIASRAETVSGQTPRAGSPIGSDTGGEPGTEQYEVT
eukprot:gene12805-16065_t